MGLDLMGQEKLQIPDYWINTWKTTGKDFLMGFKNLALSTKVRSHWSKIKTEYQVGNGGKLYQKVRARILISLLLQPRKYYKHGGWTHTKKDNSLVVNFLATWQTIARVRHLRPPAVKPSLWNKHQENAPINSTCPTVHTQKFTQLQVFIKTN